MVHVEQFSLYHHHHQSNVFSSFSFKDKRVRDARCFGLNYKGEGKKRNLSSIDLKWKQNKTSFTLNFRIHFRSDNFQPTIGTNRFTSMQSDKNTHLSNAKQTHSCHHRISIVWNSTDMCTKYAEFCLISNKNMDNISTCDHRSSTCTSCISFLLSLLFGWWYRSNSVTCN